MGLRNDIVVPQDLTDGDATAIQAIFTSAAEDTASPVRRVYTDVGKYAKEPIAYKNLDDTVWTATIAQVADTMYNNDNG